MQQIKHRRYRTALLAFSLLAASLLAGIFISRSIAVHNAIRECDTFHLRAEQRPSSIKTKIDTYRRSPVEPQWIVWIVDMRGKWTNFGGPKLEEGQPEPAPVHFGRCTVVINVFTGNALQVDAASWATNE